MGLRFLSVSLICIAIIILFAVKIVAKKINKNGSSIALSCIAGMIMLVGCGLFIRQHFISYSTPEQAYESVYGGEAQLIVDGSKSSYIIGSKGAKYLDKSEKGWRVPIMNISINRGTKIVDTTTIYVLQYNFSSDYYVIVSDIENGNLEIKDDRSSTFCKYDNKDSSLSEDACVYYAYVNKISSTYEITVNDEVVTLFRD